MAEDIFDAIKKHDLDALSRALAQGEDPNRLHEDAKYYSLHAAIFELDFGGPLKAIEMLIKAGADVNRADLGDDGAPPLLAALLDDQTKAVQMLLAAGADPNVESKLGDLPLRWCAEENDLEGVVMLLRYGANKTINKAGGISGRSALGHAVAHLNAPMVTLLLDAGADPQALDIDYQNARRHLPQRNAENAQLWDEVAALLALRSSRS